MLQKCSWNSRTTFVVSRRLVIKIYICVQVENGNLQSKDTIVAVLTSFTEHVVMQ
jgi:hypothetical protein